jgi:hypothetical protein
MVEYWRLASKDCKYCVEESYTNHIQILTLEHISIYLGADVSLSSTSNQPHLNLFYFRIYNCKAQSSCEKKCTCNTGMTHKFVCLILIEIHAPRLEKINNYLANICKKPVFITSSYWWSSDQSAPLFSWRFQFVDMYVCMYPSSFS